MNATASLKSLVLQVVPTRLLQRIKKVHYVRGLRAASDKNEPDLTVVRRLVRPGDVAVDVGANYGLYTRFLSEMTGLTGQVFSLEPVPLTYDLLESNVAKLRLNNVQTLNVAASSAAGTAHMTVPRYETGGENFYEARIAAGGDGPERRVEVPTRPLDELFAKQSPPVSFIKLDVEGHELRCLRGAAGLLTEVKPAWLIEVSGDPDDPNHSAHELMHVMDVRGYTAYWYDGEALRRREPGDRSVNYFFLTMQHVGRLPGYLLGETPRRLAA